MSQNEDENTPAISAASEFNIDTILIKELGINSAKVEMIYQMQIEILALLQQKSTDEIFGEKNERVKQLALEFYIANSIKK